MLKHTKEVFSYMAEISNNCISLSVIPALYNLWFNQLFFYEDYRTYLFIGAGVMRFLINKTLEDYKALNPWLENSDYYTDFVEIVESGFLGLQDASQMVLPFVLGDIALNIQDKIPIYIKPLCAITLSTLTGVEVLKRYGLFGKKEPAVAQEELITQQSHTNSLSL